MKYIRNLLFIALMLLLQSTLFGRYAVAGIRPDLAMLALLALVGAPGPAEIILYGFFIGFVQDVYSPEFLGVNAMTMSVAAYLLDVVKERVTVEQYPVRAGVAFIACLVHDGMYLALTTGFDGGVMMELFIRGSLPGAIYTSVLYVVMMFLLEWVRNGGLLYVLEGLLRER